MDKKGILEALIAHYTGGNKSQFAKMLGVKPQTINTWDSRSTFDIELIYSKCEHISADWLLTGEGPMLKTSTSGADEAPCPDEKERKTEKSEKNSECSSRIQKLPEGSMEGIPLIPTSAMAGAFTSDISFMEYECEHYFIPDFKGADFLIRVSGDSMTPLYCNGDIIACRKIAEIHFFQWGGVYVLDTSQGVLVKYVEECEKNDDCILCVSENKRYKPFPLPKDDIRSLSTIVGLVRLV